MNGVVNGALQVSAFETCARRRRGCRDRRVGCRAVLRRIQPNSVPPHIRKARPAQNFRGCSFKFEEFKNKTNWENINIHYFSSIVHEHGANNPQTLVQAYWTPPHLRGTSRPPRAAPRAGTIWPSVEMDSPPPTCVCMRGALSIALYLPFFVCLGSFSFFLTRFSRVQDIFTAFW